jgi:hypothetical protein
MLRAPSTLRRAGAACCTYCFFRQRMLSTLRWRSTMQSRVLLPSLRGAPQSKLQPSRRWLQRDATRRRSGAQTRRMRMALALAQRHRTMRRSPSAHVSLPRLRRRRRLAVLQQCRRMSMQAMELCRHRPATHAGDAGGAAPLAPAASPAAAAPAAAPDVAPDAALAAASAAAAAAHAAAAEAAAPDAAPAAAPAAAAPPEAAPGGGGGQGAQAHSDDDADTAQLLSFLRGIAPPLSNLPAVLAAARSSGITLAHLASIELAMREPSGQRPLEMAMQSLHITSVCDRLAFSAAMARLPQAGGGGGALPL